MTTLSRFLLTTLIACSTMATSGQNYITQRQFADKLYSKNICSEINYQKLIAKIDNKQLENPQDFLNYCDKAILIDLKKYPDKPENYLEKIHKDVSRLLPDLQFSDFKYQIVLYDELHDGDDKFYNFAISFKSKGKTYQQTSFYELYSVSKNKHYGNKIDQQSFYKIFNKILSDNQSPYRLHEVQFYGENAILPDIFGIIALTNEQAKMLHGGGVLFTPGFENFKNTLTSRQIEKAISDYRKIGLLSHLSQEKIRLATDKCARQENRNLNDVLRCFPEVIYYFDTELGNLEHPYEEILKELSRISKAVFNPTNITDNFSPENKKALIKFNFNGRAYSKELEVQGDWLDPSIFDLIKQAVHDNKLNAQFYELYTGGQDASVIFLTMDQEKYLRTNNLIVFGDQWQTQEDE